MESYKEIFFSRLSKSMTCLLGRKLKGERTAEIVQVCCTCLKNKYLTFLSVLLTAWFHVFILMISCWLQSMICIDFYLCNWYNCIISVKRCNYH